MTTEDDFQAALDAHPDDWQTRLVFADFLDERGDARAEGYRALARLERHICVYPADYELGDLQTWTWFVAGAHFNDETPRLQSDWFALLTGGRQVNHRGRAIPETNERFGSWRDYDSRRAAEDAAAVAFSKLPAERRAELLAPAPESAGAA